MAKHSWCSGLPKPHHRGQSSRAEHHGCCTCCPETKAYPISGIDVDKNRILYWKSANQRGRRPFLPAVFKRGNLRSTFGERAIPDLSMLVAFKGINAMYVISVNDPRFVQRERRVTGVARHDRILRVVIRSGNQLQPTPATMHIIIISCRGEGEPSQCARASRAREQV